MELNLIMCGFSAFSQLSLKKATRTLSNQFEVLNSTHYIQYLVFNTDLFKLQQKISFLLYLDLVKLLKTQKLQSTSLKLQ